MFESDEARFFVLNMKKLSNILFSRPIFFPAQQLFCILIGKKSDLLKFCISFPNLEILHSSVSGVLIGRDGVSIGIRLKFMKLMEIGCD